jgi:hypothetical protein
MMTDADIIEVMAQAVREVVGNKSGRGRPWSELPWALRQSYRDEASAALKAARDYADGVLTLSGADKQVAIEDAEKAEHPTTSQPVQEEYSNDAQVDHPDQSRGHPNQLALSRPALQARCFWRRSFSGRYGSYPCVAP